MSLMLTVPLLLYQQVYFERGRYVGLMPACLPKQATQKAVTYASKGSQVCPFGP